MASHKIDVIRLGQRAFQDGDLGPVKEHLAPGVDWGSMDSFPGLAPVYHGHHGMDEWMETVRSSFSDFSASLERVVADEGDRAIVVEYLSARGRESGAEVEMRIYSVYDFADGKIVRRRAFATEEEAVAAAG